MFLDLISLFVGFLCVLIACFLIFNRIENHKTNAYFVLILFIVGIQRFVYSIEFLGLIENSYNPLKKKLSLALYIVPIYYLFFRRLTKGDDRLKNELLHFILPTLFVFVNMIYEISYLFFFFYSTFYFILILILFKKFIYRKNTSMLEIISYGQIKTWLFLMISLTFLLFVYSNYFLFSGTNPQMNLGSFYRYSSLLWLLLLIYMFKNPIVIWSRKPLKTIEEKDKIVYNTILKRIGFIISDIQILQKSDEMLSTTTFTADTVAKQLKMPRRHLEFVFKYYCHYSINDFSNLVKVNYAVSLINEGYLDSYTVESLGEKCLFNSRFTFSKNFKKFIGVSVSDFVNTNVNSKLFFGEKFSL
jgi:AraC-like DNA-binding protein